ncbi:MAG: hypothetical protein AMJ41_03135 [candidate division Zixibacteria bacterium DG_27]|nr:MAG: hypothetical protein AMJ41_03135 [candidate division Zixibacteria bacterium DG_27]
MVIGVLRLELYFPGSTSLKSKRQILKSIKDRTHSRFNVSISEVDNGDLWQRATLGVAVVSKDQRYANGVLSRIADKVEREDAAEVIDLAMEFF